MELPPIPSSCNKDVVGALIDHLDLGKHSATVADLRELRDYLFTAFRDLVSSEWVRLEGLEREERVRRAQLIREAAAMMDGFIMDVNRLLGETEVGTQEDNVIAQLEQIGIDWEQNAPNLDTQEIVVPQQNSETSRSWRTSRGTRTAESEMKGEEKETKQTIDKYKNRRRLHEEQRNEVGASIAKKDYEGEAVPGPRPSYGSSRFRQLLSENILNSHKMRTVKFGDIPELTSPLSWAILPLLPWSGNRRFHPIIRYFPEVHRERELNIEPTINPLQTGIRAPNNSSSIQASRQIDLVRQHRSQNQETPDGAYFSRYDETPTRDEEAAWSATGGPTGEVADKHATSTPLKRHSELGY